MFLDIINEKLMPTFFKIIAPALATKLNLPLEEIEMEQFKSVVYSIEEKGFKVLPDDLHLQSNPTDCEVAKIMSLYPLQVFFINGYFCFETEQVMNDTIAMYNGNFNNKETC